MALMAIQNLLKSEGSQRMGNFPAAINGFFNIHSKAITVQNGFNKKKTAIVVWILQLCWELLLNNFPEMRVSLEGFVKFYESGLIKNRYFSNQNRNCTRCRKSGILADRRMNLQR